MSQYLVNNNSQGFYQMSNQKQQENIGEGIQIVRISQERFQTEFNIYLKLYQNRCLNVIEILNINDYDVIIEEYSMTLDQFIQKRQEIGLIFSKQEIQLIIAQIINGYQHLRQLGIIHRNLTPQSLLVKQIKGKQIIKLSDFSLSTIANNQELPIMTRISNSKYLVPEKGQDMQCDIFSLGLILYQLCFQQKIPNTINNQVEQQKIIKDLKQIQLKCQKTGDVDLDLIDLIEQMLVIDPQKRISWDELARIPKFQQPYKLLNKRYLIDFTRQLGSGMQGVIYLTIDLKDYLEVCVKVIDNTSIEGKREIQVYERLQGNEYSENIIQIIDCITDQNQSFVIMEKCDENIKQYFEKQTMIKEEEILDFLDQIISGYIDLQNKGIIHRDLKPENILIKHEVRKKKVKIIDFGVSKLHNPNELAITVAGTPIYSAPEVLTLTGKGYTDKCDIYSLGTMLYQFVFKSPYYYANSIEELRKFQQHLEKNPFTCKQKSIFNKLIERMLIYDPDQRISWNSLKYEVKKLMDKSSIKVKERESILHENIPPSILRYLDSLQIFSSKLEQELINYYHQTKYQNQIVKVLYFVLFFSQATLLDCQEIIQKQSIFIGGEIFKQNLTSQQIFLDKQQYYIEDLQESIEQIQIEPDQFFENQKEKMEIEIQLKRMTCYDIHKYFNEIYLKSKEKGTIYSQASIKLRYYLEKMSNIFYDYPLNNIKSILFSKLAEKIQDENAQKQYLEIRLRN
ncbi:unnamed protein product [Paramecium sonneborni]|uniref:Protein kinase domain-containing protein n=1 Tax=Paramecium sonneborni TaxID=65129 RepID=A0A8S1PAV8_9CILI|nr:unnamed protein product [Paramecium sonneborni]